MSEYLYYPTHLTSLSSNLLPNYPSAYLYTQPPTYLRIPTYPPSHPPTYV